MGLVSFVKSAGRKLGLFGGQAAAQAETAALEAAEAAREATAQAASLATESARHDAVAADMRAAILSYGIDIQGLEVLFDGDLATIMGTASSQEDREKAVLIVGNTEGAGAVDDRLHVVVPAPPAVYHTVVAGDTLSAIARSQYGVMRLFDPIFQANRPMLEHPDLIYPGQVLRIPPVSPPVHSVARGETLGSIAKHWYGDAARYTDVFEANRDVLRTPDVVEVGQQLTIPLIGPKIA